MKYFLVIAFLFFAGSSIGWCLELLWRRFCSTNNPQRKWINPGFLTGPYLPIYGCSLVFLFLLSHVKISFVKELYLQQTLLFVLMAMVITAFEYIAGLIFIKGMKIKLWDYSQCWGNVQGIICPMYSFFWYILSALYYFFIHPKIQEWLFWFVNHIEFSFFVGMFYGVFLIDALRSLNVMTKVRSFAKDNDLTIRLENLQQHIRMLNEERKEKIHFWLSVKSENSRLMETLRLFKDKNDKK